MTLQIISGCILKKANEGHSVWSAGWCASDLWCLESLKHMARTPAWAERATVQNFKGYKCVLSLMVHVSEPAFSRDIWSTDDVCKHWQECTAVHACWARNLQKPVHSDDQCNVFSRQPHWCQHYNHCHQSCLGNTCGSDAGCRGSDAGGDGKAELSAKGRKEVVAFAEMSESSSNSSLSWQPFCPGHQEGWSHIDINTMPGCPCQAPPHNRLHTTAFPKTWTCKKGSSGASKTLCPHVLWHLEL